MHKNDGLNLSLNIGKRGGDVQSVDKKISVTGGFQDTLDILPAV